MSKHLVTGRRRNSLLTGKDIQQNQTQEGANICKDWLMDEGEEKGIEPRETTNKTKTNYKTWYLVCLSPEPKLEDG